MARFHISEKGPSPCSALVRPCPYGGASGTEHHYDSLGAAEMAFALDMGGTFAPLQKKSPFKAPEEVRKGIGSDPAANATLAALDADARDFWQKKTEDEAYLLNYYKMNGYTGLKALQLGGYYREGWERNFLNRYPDQEQRDEVLSSLEASNRKLQELYTAHGESSSPRSLYRLQNVQEFSPDGSMTTDEYLSSLEEGQSFEFKSWASTTADSDFALASGEKTREFHPDRQIVMFEVVTKRGMPLHNPDDRLDALQSKEREILLAPGEKYRVVGVQRDVLYENSRQLSVSERLGGMEAQRGRYHVVQLEEVASEPAQIWPGVAASPPPAAAPAARRGSLHHSPQERMKNARRQLQGRMIDLRLGAPQVGSEAAAAVFDRAQHEISQIRDREGAEKLFSLYERNSIDAQLNTSPQDSVGQAVARAHGEVFEALRDMLGR